jgi:hypothetical protein
MAAAMVIACVTLLGSMGSALMLLARASPAEWKRHNPS